MKCANALDLFQEVVNLRGKLDELRTCVIRYRAVVGEEAAKIVEMRDSGWSFGLLG